MIKSGKILSSILLSGASIGVISIATKNSNFNLFKSDAASSYYHYRGIRASYTSSGVRDYWTDCAGNTTVIFPKGSTIIEDRNIPSETLEQIDENDARYIPAIQRSYNFEDGILPKGLFAAGATTRYEVSAEAGFNSQYGLKISSSSKNNIDFSLRLPREFLDLAFADETVESIDFDAKGNFYSNNFRHRQNGTNITYEYDSNKYGHGISQTWKTFHFTRANYNSYINDEANIYDLSVFYGALTPTDIVYIDNIRASKYGGDVNKSIDFNGGGIKASGDDFYATLISGESTSSFQLKVNSANVSSVEYTNEVVMEGTRCLKVHKDIGGYAAFVLSSSFANAIPTDGYFTFDMFIKNIEGKNNFYAGKTSVLYGDGTTFSFNLDGNRYYHITMPKSSLSNNKFLTISGSQSIGDIYFDNFRIGEHPGDHTNDCEYGYIEKNDTTFIHRVKNSINPTGYTAMFQSTSSLVTEVSLSTEITNGGDYAIKVVKPTAGYTAFFLSQAIMNSWFTSDTQTLSFDFYSTVGINSTSTVKNLQDGMGGLIKGENYTLPANQWVRFTLNKSQVTSDGRFIITQGGSQGTYYFDNFAING